MTTQTRSTTRARLAAVSTAIALAGVTTAALLTATTGSAGATGHPDLKITQHVSGSPQSGHTFDTITIKNDGSATASHVNLQMYTDTTSAFGDTFSGTGSVCEVMPAPPPWNYGTACQFSASLAHGDFGVDQGRLQRHGRREVHEPRHRRRVPGRRRGQGQLEPGHQLVRPAREPHRHRHRQDRHAQGAPHRRHHRRQPRPEHGGRRSRRSSRPRTSPAASATGSGSCQVVPPASGYDFAFSCVRDNLAQGAAWKLTFNYSGPTGKTATMVTKVTALTIDPYTKNNTITRTAKLK